MAELGLEDHRDALDVADVPLVDMSQGVTVAWRAGVGWHEGSDE